LIQADDDQRVIAAAAREYNATLIKRVDHTPELASFWIRPDEPAAFRAGQWVDVAVIADHRIWRRPYSVASPPAVAGTEGYELYVRHIPVVHFTSLLWRLQAGARLHVGTPQGSFVLEPADHRLRLYVSTGTAIAPFMSMIWQSLLSGRPVNTVLVHGVSHVADLGYRETLEGFEQSGTYPLHYVPTISRPGEHQNHGWLGRVGRLEDVLDAVCAAHGIRGQQAVAYVCGNPEMIENVSAILERRGLPPQDVRQEPYWPRGPGRPEWMLRSSPKDMTAGA